MRTLNCKGKILDIREPVIMGIINVNDDSFFPGSRMTAIDAIVQRAGMMIDSGAAILDLGGASTRPGAQDIGAKEELRRVIPAIRAIHEAYPDAIISIDTFHVPVAEKAIAEGASLINDISGGDIDPEMPYLALQHKCPYIIMHMQGRPPTMQVDPRYDDVLAEVLDYFIAKSEKMRSIGLADIIFDPGFGFGKTLEHNYTLLNNMQVFRILEKPVLAGLSRKGMLWRPLHASPEEVLPATIAVNLLALQKGASILRVHDVKENMQLLKTFKLIKQHESN